MTLSDGELCAVSYSFSVSLCRACLCLFMSEQNKHSENENYHPEKLHVVQLKAVTFIWRKYTESLHKYQENKLRAVCGLLFFY